MVKILAIDTRNELVVLQAGTGEVAQLLGFRDIYELSRTGRGLHVGDQVNVKKIHEAAVHVRQNADYLRRLRSEYTRRCHELDEAIDFAESRSEPPEEDE